MVVPSFGVFKGSLVAAEEPIETRDLCWLPIYRNTGTFASIVVRGLDIEPVSVERT
jgi:hypothetical protein